MKTTQPAKAMNIDTLTQAITPIFDNGQPRVITFATGAKVRFTYADRFLRACFPATTQEKRRFISESDSANVQQLAADVLAAVQ